MSTLKTLAIRTSFSHHSKNAGYKQIIKYLQPTYVIGIDETNHEKPSTFKVKYQWLYEIEGYFKYRKKIDLVHIMYGEDYFRFSSKLYDVPVVATFHQPATILADEVRNGTMRGRVGRVTHLLSQDRFDKLAAAIVTEYSQKEVLEEVMPAEKIHVIPLGTHLSLLNHQEKQLKVKERKRHTILTVGQWYRNWDFYFEVVKKVALEFPDWHFFLVNRRLPNQYRSMLGELQNLTYKDDVEDAELHRLYLSSSVQFLPLIGAAGNNSLLEGFALGCPMVMTDVVEREHFPFMGNHVTFHQPNNVSDALKKLEFYANSTKEQFEQFSQNAKESVAPYDWKSIANKTLEIYNSLV